MKQLSLNAKNVFDSVAWYVQVSRLFGFYSCQISKSGDGVVTFVQYAYTIFIWTMYLLMGTIGVYISVKGNYHTSKLTLSGELSAYVTDILITSICIAYNFVVRQKILQLFKLLDKVDEKIELLGENIPFREQKLFSFYLLIVMFLYKILECFTFFYILAYIFGYFYEAIFEATYCIFNSWFGVLSGNASLITMIVKSRYTLVNNIFR